MQRVTWILVVMFVLGFVLVNLQFFFLSCFFFFLFPNIDGRLYGVCWLVLWKNYKLLARQIPPKVASNLITASGPEFVLV